MAAGETDKSTFLCNAIKLHIKADLSKFAYVIKNIKIHVL